MVVTTMLLCTWWTLADQDSRLPLQQLGIQGTRLKSHPEWWHEREDYMKQYRVIVSLNQQQATTQRRSRLLQISLGPKLEMRKNEEG